MSWNKEWCFVEDEDLTIITDEWNPMTFAIYVGSEQLIRMFIERTSISLKKAVKLPNSSFYKEIQKLYPLLIAFENDN